MGIIQRMQKEVAAWTSKKRATIYIRLSQLQKFKTGYIHAILITLKPRCILHLMPVFIYIGCLYLSVAQTSLKNEGKEVTGWLNALFC